MTISEKLRENLNFAHAKAQPYVEQVQKTAGQAYTTVQDKFVGTKGGLRHVDSSCDVTVRLLRKLVDLHEDQ